MTLDSTMNSLGGQSQSQSSVLERGKKVSNLNDLTALFYNCYACLHLEIFLIVSSSHDDTQAETSHVAMLILLFPFHATVATQWKADILLDIIGLAENCLSLVHEWKC